MSGFKVGDTVKDAKKSYRGKAVIKELRDDAAKLHYPQFNLTVYPVRVRDLVKETP